ncbi:MAG TPA: hypothetical protein VFA12_15660 [Stellaceae bacterium]|nr:hypothetical protein [Stellaceae bacterium]
MNGVARLEFQRLESVQRGGNRELKPVTEVIVALPVNGFLGALTALDNVREKLAAQGAASPIAANAAPADKSPNFS